jgi:hypothetical protein
MPSPIRAVRPENARADGSLLADRDAPPAARNPPLELAEWLAFWMDRRYIDPLLALLLPGAGDAIGAVIGLLGVFAAFKLRAHPLVIARMLLNLAIDALLGAIPFAGPVFDLFYRANSRNLELLKSRDVREPRASDVALVGGAALLFVAALLAPLFLLAWLVSLVASSR